MLSLHTNRSPLEAFEDWPVNNSSNIRRRLKKYNEGHLQYKWSTRKIQESIFKFEIFWSNTLYGLLHLRLLLTTRLETVKRQGNIPWNRTPGSVIPPPHIDFLDWYNRNGSKCAKRHKHTAPRWPLTAGGGPIKHFFVRGGITLSRV